MKSFLFTILFITSVFGHGDNRKCHTQDNCECHPVCLSTRDTICYEDFIYLKNNGKIPHSVYIIGKGDCKERYKVDCICCSEQEHVPVCGTDHQDYLNLCELRCVAGTNYGQLNNLEFAHFGYCRNEPPPSL